MRVPLSDLTMMFRRTPLAALNMLHGVKRLLVALCGVGFAVVLMFMQTGFKNALFDSTVEIIRQLDGQLILVSRGLFALVAAEGFARPRLQQAAAVDGVAAVYPLYVEQGIWQAPGHKATPIRVLAFEPRDRVFASAQIQQQTHLLQMVDTALLDLASKEALGIPSHPRQALQMRPELSGRLLRLVGLFRLGTDFVNDGNLLMGAHSFAKYFAHRVAGGDPLSRVDLAVIHLRPGVDVATTMAKLRQRLPADVTVWDKQAFVDREIDFWNHSTPIGFVFSLGTIVGFVVGMIVCYQVIHADISDHLREFATLKAMGYTNRYFLGLVVMQAGYLSLLSFLPGLLVSLLLFQVLSSATGLLMVMTLSRAFTVLALTATMCLISGILALRKLLQLDPAELF